MHKSSKYKKNHSIDRNSLIYISKPLSHRANFAGFEVEVGIFPDRAIVFQAKVYKVLFHRSKFIVFKIEVPCSLD